MKFEKEMLAKLDSHKELTEYEISELVYEYEEDEQVNDRGRWEDFVFTVVKLENRYFGINWNRGLTEMQEDCFMDQPYEVEEKKIIVTKTITDWIIKK